MQIADVYGHGWRYQFAATLAIMHSYNDCVIAVLGSALAH